MCVVQDLSRSWLSSRVNRVLLILILILILFERKEKRKAELFKRSRLKKKKLLEVGMIAVRKLQRKIYLLVQCSTVQYVCRNLQSSIFNNQQKAVGSLCTADYSWAIIRV